MDASLRRGLNDLRKHAHWLKSKEDARSVRGSQVEQPVQQSANFGSVSAASSMSTLTADGGLGRASSSRRQDKRSAKKAHDAAILKSKVYHAEIFKGEFPIAGVEEARKVPGYEDENKLADRLEKLHASLKDKSAVLRRYSYLHETDMNSILSDLQTRQSYPEAVLSTVGARSAAELGNPYRAGGAAARSSAAAAAAMDSLVKGERQACAGSVRSVNSSIGNASVGSRSAAELRNRDSRVYSKSQRVCRLGSLSATVRSAPSKSGQVPSLREVTESTAMLSRKNLIAYDTRIVETGALLKVMAVHGAVYMYIYVYICVCVCFAH